MTINSKFKGLSAAAAAVSLFAITPARSGPVLPDRLELSTWRAPVEPAGYHWQRHYHQAYAADDYAAEELAMTALFWPLWSSDCCFGGCGWTVATDPGCYFYGCGAGWGLGSFAWGLFGLGFADPYGISGWGYSGLGYGEFGYPGFGGYGGVADCRSPLAWVPVWAPACLPGVISRAAISGVAPTASGGAISPAGAESTAAVSPAFTAMEAVISAPIAVSAAAVSWRSTAAASEAASMAANSGAFMAAASTEAASMEGDFTAAAAVSPRVLSPGRAPARRWRRGFESNARPEWQYDLALPDGRLV